MGVLEDSLFVNEDWSALVPAGSPEAAFGITPRDAKRRGLLPLAKDETLGEPEKLLTSANLLPVTDDNSETEVPDAEPVADPEPEEVVAEVKEAPKPADKAVKKPANKGAARKEPADGDRR